MKREIIFRGKSIESGSFIYGDLTGEETIHVDTSFNDADNYQWWGVRVNRDTVGQFTGMCDKNDNKVYEGDILKLPETVFNSEIIGALEYKNGCFVMISRSGSMWDLDYCLDSGAIVIGNVFDNPEFITQHRKQ